MGEQTIEQLEAEYKTLLLEKLNSAKKEKEELDQKKQTELLNAQRLKDKEELKAELKKEMGYTATSRLDESSKKPVNMTSDRSFETFKANYIERANKKGLAMKGRSYEDLVETLQYGKGAL